jgi:hypothetical protein
MRSLKRFITGAVLGGMVLGLFHASISLAACQVTAKSNACCCPAETSKSADCCPMKKTSKNCPVLKQADVAPQAILPTEQKITVVFSFEPILTGALKPVTDNQHLALFQGLAPPNDVTSNCHSLRAPPSLA